MPNCFQLFPKTAPGNAATFNSIDAAMCEHFNEPCDPKRYIADWYTVIGTLIAVKGLTLGSRALRLAVIDWYADGYSGLIDVPTRREYMGSMIRIVRYLETHYTSNAWVEVGKR